MDLVGEWYVWQYLCESRSSLKITKVRVFLCLDRIADVSSLGKGKADEADSKSVSRTEYGRV